ncbi:MAG TPA: tRNA adenosine(34) deaminase TadA [Candidatus Kapabacteria bacterium]|nr:tRNA adenosine(34) deaminase TadA [Candidatus Kapabacteria bacterium]
MDQDQLFFMEKAFEQAELAYQAEEVPIGAVIVLNNEIIAAGYNSVIKNSDPTAHAEIIALRAAGKTLNNYRLLDTAIYVTLEPCIMCYAALVHARVKYLYYGAGDPKGGIFSTGKFDLIKNIFNHTIEAKSGIIGDKTSRLIRDFFQARRGAGAAERDGLENR